MKNIFKIKLSTTWDRILTASIIALILAWLLCGCAASNKAHWNKVHPNGGWAGRHWIHGIDTIKTIVKR